MSTAMTSRRISEPSRAAIEAFLDAYYSGEDWRYCFGPKLSERIVGDTADGLTAAYRTQFAGCNVVAAECRDVDADAAISIVWKENKRLCDELAAEKHMSEHHRSLMIDALAEYERSATRMLFCGILIGIGVTLAITRVLELLK